MRGAYRVVELCQALAVSRSGYYRWRSAKAGVRRRQNRLLLAEIKRIHADRHTRCYGSPRMSVELNHRGFRCSVNRVARLMKLNAIKACRGRSYRPKTTRQDPRSLPSPNHLAEAPDPTGPGQIMVSDITYVPTRQGWLYLAVVMDLFGRVIQGYKVDESLASGLVVSALRQAGNRVGSIHKALFHSDRGCQYTSHQVREQLSQFGWIQSMSATGYCYDNATCESLLASLKSECFPQNGVFETKRQARLAMFDYIETFYNKRRRHSSLGYLSPEAFLKKHFQNQNHNLT